MTGNISYIYEYDPYDGGYVSFRHGGEKITGKGIIKTGKYFKLNDDTNMLLRTPRQHNMHSIDLNNIVRHKNLTCLVTKALVDENHLRKFDAKGDEGYFVGYSLSSKAFNVFNKRTKKVEENLHKDFLENKLIEKRAGPNWLFDINTLTNSMNYVPVVIAGTYSTNILGTKDVASQAVKKDVSPLRYIAIPNWFHEAHMETSNDTM
nr:ribonuclease H-like domain-containing protein [Tanacetum cinerariifolium]GEZ38641.1 ribonuclease H-like domain-containing protein [Tanacetum cinerariifolium]